MTNHEIITLLQNTIDVNNPDGGYACLTAKEIHRHSLVCLTKLSEENQTLKEDLRHLKHGRAGTSVGGKVKMNKEEADYWNQYFKTHYR